MSVFNTLFFSTFNSFCDIPTQFQLGLQDAATHDMNSIHDFYDILMFCIIAIGSFVFYLLFYSIFTFNSKKHPRAEQFAHSNELEIVWTVIPAIILFCLAIPSFRLLYQLEHFKDESLIVKVVGHQWYWSYEMAGPLNDALGVTPYGFNSYMLKGSQLFTENGDMYPRLLQTDAPLVLPIKTPIKLLVTATDVIHSWAVPSLGVKMDATPGRLTQVMLTIERTGNFYGQCSEICGINHAFMPIHVCAITIEQYIMGLLTLIKGEINFKESAFQDLFLNTFIDMNSLYMKAGMTSKNKATIEVPFGKSTIDATKVIEDLISSVTEVEFTKHDQLIDIDSIDFYEKVEVITQNSNLETTTQITDLESTIQTSILEDISKETELESINVETKE